VAAPQPAPAPSDGTHSVTEVARLLDVTPRRLQQMAREGIVPLPDRGRYDTARCVRGYIKFLRGEMGERLEAKLRREAAMADRAELEVARTKGEIIENAKRWLAGRVAEVRTVIERWPERVAALLAADLGADPEQVYLGLERHTRELLLELAGRGGGSHADGVPGRDQA
jgi:hypothetical protein